MNDSIKENNIPKHELNREEKEQFILKLLISKDRLTFNDIKREFNEKRITYKGNLITDNTIYNYISNLEKYNFIEKIGKTQFKIEFSNVIKEIKHQLESGSINYDDILNINYSIGNLKKIIATLIKLNILEIIYKNNQKLLRLL